MADIAFLARSVHCWDREVTMQGLASGLLLVAVFAAVAALAVLLGLRLLRATRGAAGEPPDAREAAE
jgi:hypothetical protein